MRKMATYLFALTILIPFATTLAVGGKNDVDTVNDLLEDLKSSDYEKAWGAAQRLSEFPHDRTRIVPALIKALGNQWNSCSGDIREAIAYSLTELKAKEAVFPLLELIRGGKNIEHECAECGCCFLAMTPADELTSRGFDPFCANSVLSAINQLADFSHSKAMADIVSAGKWQPELIITLGKVGLPRYAYFISRYKDDKDVTVRRAVAIALGLIKNDSITIPVLLQMLSRRGEDFLVRSEASNSLMTILKNRRAANLKNPLMNLLNDRNKTTVLLAARVLATDREEQALLKLRELATDEDPQVRSEAVMYLGEASDVGSREVLIERLGDESLKVRALAMFALGRVGDPSIIPVLRRAFEQSQAYQEELEKKQKSTAGENEKTLHDKYGLGVFDLRTTLEEAVDAARGKATREKPPNK